jgi:hypothetical protein
MTDTDDPDEAAYLRREQARFRLYKKIESLQQQQEYKRVSEKPAGESSFDPV